MPTVKGTQTERNLLKSFAGESQARNRYTFAAKVAKKEGYEQISALFLETAENERQHAKGFFKFLEGGMVEITAAYPAGVIGTTIENLKSAAEGEHEEHTLLYPESARVAREEGFPQIATFYNLVSGVEKHHEERYRMLLKTVEEGTTFKKAQAVKWVCRQCGHIHEGPEAPVVCPCCDHPRAHFQLLTDAY